MLRFLLACLIGLFAVTAAAAEPPAPAIIVLDSSGSMAGRLPGGEIKLDAAREVISETLSSWPAAGEVGLIAYGHRRKSDCADIETILPLGPLSVTAVGDALRPLMARGKTPLSQALQAAAVELPAGRATIILVSDGIETCEADPCATAEALKAAHPGLAINVVGFELAEGDAGQLGCVAERGGGRFFDAKDAAGLSTALDSVKVDVVAPPEPAVVSAPPVTPAETPPPAPAAAVRTHLVATAGQLGALSDTAVAWNVADASGNSVYAGDSRALALDLLPGGYEVSVDAANASGKAGITVSAGQEQTFEVAIPAGRADLSLASAPGGEPYTDAEAAGVVWRIDPLDGQSAVAVPSVARPSMLLADGAYRVTAELDGVTATGELKVVAGKIVDVPLDLHLGTLKLEAVLEGVTEPISDDARVGWRVGDGKAARTVSGQALPTLTLPEGQYPVTLLIAGAELEQTAEVTAGKETLARVVVPGGTLTLSARLGPDSPPLDDWRDTFWTVAPVSTLAAADAVEAQEPTPSFPLSAGSWKVTLQSGSTSAERDVEVAPGKPTELVLTLDAARVTMSVSTPSGAATGDNVVYSATAIDASGARAASPSFETGSSEAVTTILPAGRWAVTAETTDMRAEAEIELAPGEERGVVLALR